MISMHEIGSAEGAAIYFEKAFSQDGVVHADNYYIGEKSTALWQGRGAEILGLEGKIVNKEDFTAFLEGKLSNPVTGEIQDLSKNSKGADRLLGWDFTVAPPKSVSIVGLVGNDERVQAAHLAANERAMSWLEKNASVIRVFDEKEGRSAKQAGNLLYATVLHETNRNNEPQIHSHNVIVSAVFDDEAQKWRSLTNEELFVLRQGADSIYKAELSHALQRAGYKIEHDPNGVDFEIAGLSREQIEAYSTRRTEIVKALKDRGLKYSDADYQQRMITAIDTRSAKHDQPRDILHSVWQDVAAIAKLDVEKLVSNSKANAITNENSVPGQSNATNAVLWAVAHLSEREQSYKRTDIELAALKFGKGRIDEIEKAVDQQIEKGVLVDRGINAKGASLLTTKKAIELEKEYVANIKDGIGKGKVVLSSEAEFTAALNRFEDRKSKEIGAPFKLSGEQLVAAKNVLTHGDTYQGVQGDAGTGKTAALEMVREVAEAKGWVVMGIATTSAAAKELQASSGISSQTVAGFLKDRDNALRLAEMEIVELRKALATREAPPQSAISRIEIHKLSVNSEGIDKGAVRYAFDNERGAVYRSPDNLRNQLGAFLLDAADKQKRGKTVDRGAIRESLGDRLRVRAGTSGAAMAEAIGKRLTTYEKVGTVESIAARGALHLQQDRELSALRFQIESKQAEIANINQSGNAAGRKTLLVMDESSLTGIDDAVKITRLAKTVNARVVFQGDVKQHGSVPAGKAFDQALDAGMNKSVLQETRRFDNATGPTKEAVALMSSGRMSEAISKLDRIEVENRDLSAVVSVRYLKNLEELKTSGSKTQLVGVVAITNDDRKEINKAVHDILSKNGHVTGRSFEKQHLDNPKLTEAEQLHASMLQNAGVDRLSFRKAYQEIGVKKNDVVRVTGFNAEKNLVTIINSRGKEIQFNPKQQDFFTPLRMESREYGVGDKIEARSNIHFDDKKMRRIDNGERGIISAIDEKGATIKWAAPTSAKDEAREVRLNNDQLRMVDLSYARTTYKEQGATNDREIIAVSKVGAKVFNTQAAYVAGSRAKGNTEIVTSDYETMLRNSGKLMEKTTAIDVDANKARQAKQGTIRDASQDLVKVQEKDKALQQARNNQQLGFMLE